ncbi:hypothetical protein SBOR_2152 [Sclerotinia borealis F-4128]|uniref:Xylanolytic transcriptional activator regulatory domain-containing protein n=1 Tax=Sclerotinia borealis (strain F-4128) TaxID=1432307 RepID=W9CN57_SCLBF|nr:hypothetical protein SBOR_2152 [Sclerotinia borealis F-4128]
MTVPAPQELVSPAKARRGGAIKTYRAFRVSRRPGNQRTSGRSPDIIIRNAKSSTSTHLRSEPQSSLEDSAVQSSRQEIHAASTRHPESLVDPLFAGESTTNITSTRASTRESSPFQRSTMLRSSQGEQVYIGNIAAISFLRFLQTTLKRYIGTSVFTERQESNVMLEVEVSRNNSPFEDDLDLAEKQNLIACFMRVSNGILHLFSQNDISRLLNIKIDATNSSSSSSSQREDLACLFLMLAIGAQSRGKDPLEIQLAKRYFAQAQQMAFLDMLENPSLCMVKLFLLMAMYMLGACRRNTAFMYIGIASKSATILGLHVPYQHSRVSSDERAARRRIWMSSRVLDLLCSSILARPSSIPSIERDEYEIDSSNPEDMDHRTLALYATYESSSIIETIVKKFAESSSVDIHSADTYLQMLREWSQALPSALRSSPDSASEEEYCETTIGNIHVSCTYYLGIMMVTRQFLISHVMSQLRKNSSNKSRRNIEVPATSAGEREKIVQFSDACVQSAHLMVQLCYEAHLNNVLLDNMCILKAWLFSAGLVLGFSLLVEGEIPTHIHESFDRACTVLMRLARLSPQAEQYHDILCRFHTAIELYRQQLLKAQKESNNLYVEKIMTFESFSRGPSEGGSNTEFRSQLQSQPIPMNEQTMFDEVEGQGDLAEMYAMDFFGIENEIQMCDAQIGYDTGVAADLRWLCYAAGPA